MYEDVFEACDVSEVLSPPQPVNERDIKSSTRTVWEAWFRTKDTRSVQFMTFNTPLEGWAWLAVKAEEARRPL